MDVEIVRDKMPLCGLWFGSDSALDVLQEILFGAGGAGGTGRQPSCDNVKIEQKCEGTMSNIFKFTPLHFAGQHGQIGMFAFQRLDPGHFIGTFNALPLFGKFRGLFVQLVDIADFVIKISFIGRREPVPAQMWLNDSLFLKAWPHGEEKCFPQSCASSLPRRFRAQSNA